MDYIFNYFGYFTKQPKKDLVQELLATEVKLQQKATQNNSKYTTALRMLEEAGQEALETANHYESNTRLLQEHIDKLTKVQESNDIEEKKLRTFSSKINSLFEE